MPTGVFLGAYPDARFTVNRAYVHTLSIADESLDVERDDDQFTVWIDRPTGYGHTYVIQPYIFDWSSNSYTLDHIVYDCWWFYGFDGVHHAQAFTVNYWWVGTPLRPHITIINPFSSLYRKDFTLPPAPSEYWLPVNL